MILWLVFALMTAAAIFAVLWPLGRAGETSSGGSDVVVYRDQLDEIDRDRAAGQIGEAEAEAAKVEVSRRLLAAADAVHTEQAPNEAPAVWRRRAAAVAGLLLLPIGATALYLALGSPDLPGEPLAARLKAIHQNSPIANLVAQAEAHLARNPDDVRGYEVLAPVYLRLGRVNDAVHARRKILALAGENAARQADLGEALVAAANGIVTKDAKTALDRALELDPKEMKARFYTAVAAQQDGKPDEAARIWRKMLAEAPADAPWLPTVRRALASVDQKAAPAVRGVASAGPIAGAAGPSAADVAAASKMSEQDRGQMIRGMVARLAGRLKENGGDVDGWQRLMRAYMVLGERDKAQAAAADARKALAGDPEKLRQIEDMIKSLGLQG
jgi:cytochrome c-type biogenesis protein CcmH